MKKYNDKLKEANDLSAEEYAQDIENIILRHFPKSFVKVKNLLNHSHFYGKFSQYIYKCEFS